MTQFPVFGYTFCTTDDIRDIEPACYLDSSVSSSYKTNLERFLEVMHLSRQTHFVFYHQPAHVPEDITTLTRTPVVVHTLSLNMLMYMIVKALIFSRIVSRTLSVSLFLLICDVSVHRHALFSRAVSSPQ